MNPPTKPPSGGRTRRDLLETGAGALAAGVAASTAGCLSSLPPLGRRQSYGRLDAPPADDPAFRRWLPAPSATGDDRSHYPVSYARPAPVDGDEPELLLARRASDKERLDYFGVGYRNYDRLLDTPFGTVVEAEFDPSAVARTLTESGYDPDGSHREYELFARSDVPRRAAVREGAILWSSRNRHERPNVEALADAEAGERRRYHEASPSFARVSEAVGASRRVVIYSSPFMESAELEADAFRLSDEAAYQVVKLLFPEDRTPTVEELERANRETHRWTDEAEVFDARLDGRLGTLETRVSGKDARSLSALEDPPQVTWGVSFDAEARRLTVRHEAGEPVDAELLWSDVDTESAPGEVEKRPLWTGTDEVRPGDSDAVDLSDRPEATHVNLVLADDECCDFRTPFHYSVEDFANE